MSPDRPAGDVAAAARKARGAIEDLLALLEWPDERALSLAIDRLLQIEERAR
jgi:hypothetical protein